MRLSVHMTPPEAIAQETWFSVLWATPEGVQGQGAVADESNSLIILKPNERKEQAEADAGRRRDMDGLRYEVWE
ncbi:hypothetical protein MLD38_030009 [Melastoma candidum]|uniref:Uncharacterized protein n=1 Tax=Melastoma candidum TaxID=119954 RepID=A0ACB9MNY0_9MYRT|nr:hypothetical protein MLD38_030009 [Melastoma candidum]